MANELNNKVPKVLVYFLSSLFSVCFRSSFGLVLVRYCPFFVRFWSDSGPFFVRFLSVLCPFFVRFLSDFFSFLVLSWSFLGPFLVLFWSARFLVRKTTKLSKNTQTYTKNSQSFASPKHISYPQNRFISVQIAIIDEHCIMPNGDKIHLGNAKLALNKSYS